MIFKNNSPANGYVAITSAIVISVLLLAIMSGLGFSGFFARINIIDSESKQKSMAQALACVDTAILEATRGAYSNGKIIKVGLDESDICTIISSQKNSPILGQTTVITQAVVNASYTNIKVIIDNTSFAVISFQECAVLDSC